ncbi:hypothetical protein [Mesorhizobium sp. Cs1321R2N1]|uniref:hypothetical protein n=1 Tax=Mesorhizobium sp. Cs1321R2N1 TaxID=3015174 RepID=UPI00301C572E
MAVQSKVCNPEAFDRLACGIGVADASFAVRERTIFCVMELPSSWKSTRIRHITPPIETTAGQVIVAGGDANHPASRDIATELRFPKFAYYAKGFATYRDVAIGLADKHFEYAAMASNNPSRFSADL